jgi:succinate-semialdehyde dehydrogenase/glutarate-semialdehyde dehydrogenase
MAQTTSSKPSKLQSFNPTTGELLKEWDFISDQELEQKVKKAEKGLDAMENASFAQRASWMLKAAEIIDRNRQKYAETITKEMGKPIEQANYEMKMCSDWCRYYADNAEQILKDQPVKSDIGKNCFISYERLGVLFQVAPFNFPFHQVIRFLAPALMAGNACLFRHSHSVSMCAFHLQDIFNEAGFPEGAVQLLMITKDQSNRLISDPRIRGISLTGSTGAGKFVAKLAGENVKPHVMELGGSDAYIICNDADLKDAVQKCVKGRIVNNGQSCVAAKRFIAVKEVYDQFVKEFVETMKNMKMGDPMKGDTDVGPLARKDLRDTVHNSVTKAVSEGAKLLLGGQLPQGSRGFFYPPTVLVDVTPENTAFREEFFAPVASIIKADNEQHAIQLANMSRYGLGGGVFTKDENKGVKIARKFDSGMAFVNRIVDQRPQYPFGGVKDSGYGKESGEIGIKEWTRTKFIAIH